MKNILTLLLILTFKVGYTQQNQLPIIDMHLHAYETVPPGTINTSWVERMVNSGFGKRIMFGSDNMVQPKTVEIGIETIEKAAFLTAEQKRDILFNNAARFLRLLKSKLRICNKCLPQ